MITKAQNKRLDALYKDYLKKQKARNLAWKRIETYNKKVMQVS